MLTRSNRHPALLRAHDTVLVVVDMQEPFLRGVWERERVIARANLLIKAARPLRIPIIPTLQYEDRMGGIIHEVNRTLPHDCVPFNKMSFSCMGDDAFASELQRSGRRQVLLCGVEAHICVCQTALDMTVQGLQVHVAADAISARSRDSVDAGLRKMAAAGVVVSNAEMAIYEMLVEAGTPEFREILSLVKEADGHGPDEAHAKFSIA